MESNIQQYLPPMYEGVQEMDAIMSTENTEFDQLYAVLSQGFNNQFILESDEKGVEYYEHIFNIPADPEHETLDFRKTRILSRSKSTIPYTFPFLRKKLDELFGPNNWSSYINFSTYTLIIEYAVYNQIWSHEVAITVNNVKPCNMVFVGIPRATHLIGVSEQVLTNEFSYNYFLDESWSLGDNFFASFNQDEEIKMNEDPSVQPKLLNVMANFAANDVAKIKLNDFVIVTNFNTRSAQDNIGIVEYVVDVSMGVSPLTNIKLLDVNNNVLTDSTVYVPINDNTLIKHRINVSEVV